jgi:hypothetical protein
MHLAQHGWLQAARNAGAKLRSVGSTIGHKAPEVDSQARSWSESIRQVTADLDQLNHNTEQGFLKIGGKLAEFMEAVNLISSELTALANLISGEQGRGASEALTAALDRSREMRKHSEDGKGELDGMRQEADQLRRTLAEFGKTISNFHTLGVLTRIETARLHTAGSDFGDLADDMKALAGEVQARVQSALETAASLIVPIESALRDIRALEEGQSRDLPSVISRVQANLSSFCEIQQRAHDSVIRLRAQSDAISTAFMKVIVSIQFHDITRQQVEHVVNILRRLSETPGKQRGSVAVLTLQSSQLADAAGKFAVSVASVASNLDDVAAHVLEMVEESRTLSSSSALEKDSFLLPMAQGCSAILDNLILCGETEAAAQAMSGSLSEPIGHMRESIEGIQAIEVQMQRMGLNANIRAAHVGVAGDALCVLSRNMQHLATECAQRSDCLIEALGSMRAATARLSGQHGSSPIVSHGGQDTCMEGLRAAVAELHSSSESSLVQTARIVDCGARLRQDLAETRESFSIGALFSETVSRARVRLKEIGEMSESGSPADHAAVLADFATNYTMQSERDVYRSATKAPLDAMGEGDETSDFAPKEAGEDVEFF